ncbi:hypothetical protein SAMN05421630_106140 [Prauserella marina]|uniref:Uncharacterized protein n=1 Tax=Prauserella marina TaxID=530584 RepID=A0A1G6SE75_9PSEU|nr:hypothetical protein DES30_102140 [Prauserella marina]SDD15053.1 hypothetical protein SAMN05421630_106140 [Prauserella marina]
MRKESACPTTTALSALQTLTTATAPRHRRTSGGLAHSSTARRQSESAGAHSTTRAASASRRSSQSTPAVALNSKPGNSHCRTRLPPGITNHLRPRSPRSGLPPRRADPRPQGAKNHHLNPRLQRNPRRPSHLPGISVENPWGQARSPDQRRHPPRRKPLEGNPRPRPTPTPGKSVPISKLRSRSRARNSRDNSNGLAGRNPGPRWRGLSRGSSRLANSPCGRTTHFGRSKAGNSSAASRGGPNLRAWRPFPMRRAPKQHAPNRNGPNLRALNRHAPKRSTPSHARKHRGRTSSRPTSRPATWPRCSKATSTRRLPHRRTRRNRPSDRPRHPGRGGPCSHHLNGHSKTG